MVRSLVIASIAWPLLMGGVVWARLGGERPAWTGVVYAAASFICHQRPERSFHTNGVQWPVCGRCSGLYLSAPFGAIAAVAVSGRRRGRARAGGLMNSGGAAVRLVAVAALPTAVTWIVEVLHIAAPSSLTRAMAALPLGAAIAFVMVAAVADAPGSTPAPAKSAGGASLLD